MWKFQIVGRTTDILTARALVMQYPLNVGMILHIMPSVELSVVYLQHGSSTTSVKINERWLHTFASLFEYYLTLYIMKRTFALLLTTAIAVTSCGSLFKYTSYDVSLSSVESPANAKVKYGETKIASFEEDGQSKYRYEDDFINISWYVGIHKFYFTLKNKSDYSMKIPWDDIVYVDISSNTQRVMHSGVKYTDRNSSQPATIVPKNASISDVLLPTDNVKYVGGSTGWDEGYLFPQYKKQEDASANYVIGKKIRIILPIIIQDVQNEYSFEFTINDATIDNLLKK